MTTLTTKEQTELQIFLENASHEDIGRIILEGSASKEISAKVQAWHAQQDSKCVNTMEEMRGRTFEYALLCLKRGMLAFRKKWAADFFPPDKFLRIEDGDFYMANHHHDAFHNLHKWETTNEDLLAEDWLFMTIKMIHPRYSPK